MCWISPERFMLAAYPPCDSHPPRHLPGTRRGKVPLHPYARAKAGRRARPLDHPSAFSPPASIVGGSPSSRTRASDNPSQPASGTRPGQPPSAMRASGRLQLAPGSSSRPGPPPESLRARRDKLAASPACLCEAGPLTGSSTRPVDLLTSDFARSNVWLLWPYLRRREGGTPLLGR
jgi:hypothetical protein